ncbi:bacteriohemerythrin [Tissierella sp. Yu-01]|uniref:bacteriohemerythrin n=1 Tax=Tissierella sp. Yu-01 TaxID=3035694 RepID=UPI00240DFE42|nr:bacteriohemerythrin [Tissierella sp. Yu-01]WFA08604.1 bacteriohemerythrin [Tissierella sp. Yu-01]
MIKWEDKYLLGIDIIDEQHKELFRIAGEAFDLLKNEFYLDKYDHVVKIIEELKDYAVYHFKTEEEYMFKNNYKKYFSHKIIHDEFLEEVKKINLDDMDENQDEYLLSIINFVVDWIVEHILGTDKLYVSEESPA